jgi:MFS family permease
MDGAARARHPARMHPWLMVAICTAMAAMGFGVLFVMAVFLTPLAAEFGWPRADVSLAYAVATIGTGIGGIVMGHFSDRMPIRRVAVCGAVVPAIALVLLSRMDSLGELYAYHALLGLFGVGAILAPLNSLAAQWLARNPALAIGILSAGGAAGQGLLPFLARHLLILDGWRHAYLVLGILYLVVMLPLALLIRDAPRPGSAAAAAAAAGQRTYARSRVQVLAILCVAVVFCCVCMATPIMHVVALGSDLGLGGRASAGLLATMMVAGIVGRIAFGSVADRFGSLRSYIVASAGQTSLAFLFPYAGSGLALYALAATFGLVFSGAMSSLIACGREYSPAGRTGLSIGVVMFAGWVGMAAGAWQGGLFYDLCGDYFQSFSNASFAGVVNLALLALLYTYTINPRPWAPRPQTAP